MTQLVQAEVDGRRLTDDELGAFFVLLSVAGNDTTRNTMTLTTMALQEYPDQRALLINDFDAHIHTAIEEFARWASPVMTFRRTVIRDTVLRDRELREGDWVLLMYSSGNRDERAIPNPNTFDIRRKPNNHVAFGGGARITAWARSWPRCSWRHSSANFSSAPPTCGSASPNT